MHRHFLALALFLCAAPLAAQTKGEPDDTLTQPSIEARIAELTRLDAPLVAARENSLDCDPGCILPSEAAQLAFEAGEGEPQSGRFLLDINGGGRSITGELGDLFFVSSRVDYARFGTLTIAMTPEALRAILRRARVCNPDRFTPGRIDVTGCYTDANFELNIFTMIQRLGGRRIVVDGQARLQWIDARTGLPRPVSNIRGEHEAGYYQVWVRVDDADQVIFLHED